MSKISPKDIGRELSFCQDREQSLCDKILYGLREYLFHSDCEYESCKAFQSDDESGTSESCKGWLSYDEFAVNVRRLWTESKEPWMLGALLCNITVHDIEKEVNFDTKDEIEDQVVKEEDVLNKVIWDMPKDLLDSNMSEIKFHAIIEQLFGAHIYSCGWVDFKSAYSINNINSKKRKHGTSSFPDDSFDDDDGDDEDREYAEPNYYKVATLEACQKMEEMNQQYIGFRDLRTSRICGILKVGKRLHMEFVNYIKQYDKIEKKFNKVYGIPFYEGVELEKFNFERIVSEYTFYAQHMNDDTESPLEIPSTFVDFLLIYQICHLVNVDIISYFNGARVNWERLFELTIWRDEEELIEVCEKSRQNSSKEGSYHLTKRSYDNILEQYNFLLRKEKPWIYNKPYFNSRKYPDRRLRALSSILRNAGLYNLCSFVEKTFSCDVRVFTPDDDEIDQ